MYFWYYTDTGEYIGAGPEAPIENGVSSTDQNPRIGDYYDFDLHSFPTRRSSDLSSTDQNPRIGDYYDFDTGFTKQAFWTGSEWELRDV